MPVVRVYDKNGTELLMAIVLTPVAIVLGVFVVTWVLSGGTAF